MEVYSVRFSPTVPVRKIRILTPANDEMEPSKNVISAESQTHLPFRLTNHHSICNSQEY